MDSLKLECERCRANFSQKSSLIRHARKCGQSKPQSARRKSCRECVSAKTRCDLKRPACSRCKLRQSNCQYTIALETDSSIDEGSVETPPGSLGMPPGVEGLGTPLLQTSIVDVLNNDDTLLSTLFGLDQGNTLSFLDSNFNIFDNIDADISNQELSLVMGAGPDEAALSVLQPTPATPLLVKHSMEYIFRVLKTWPRMMAKGIQLPPMIHPMQTPAKTRSKWLSNCFTVTKMWAGQYPGTSELVEDTVKKEMEEIMNSFQTFKEHDLLAALQALSIYTIILLFPSDSQSSLPILPEDMFRKLRQIVYHVAGSGLVLDEENIHIRPTWEAWIHVSTKRRAVLTLYLIHWSYSVYHSLPSFDCKDLGYMPAPAAKYLWQATERKHWEGLYNRWLAQWDGADYYQWEFFDIPPGVRVGDRAEMWLEDADEFGMIFMSIVNAHVRGPEFEIVHL